MKNMIYYSRLFAVLLWRDVKVYSKKWHTFAINYIFFCPVVYTFLFGYIIPYSTLEQPSVAAATVFFAGSSMWIFFPLAFMLSLDLFFDLQQNRFIDYQLTFAPARLVLLERIFFFSCITWIHVIPYYPIARWLLGDYFDTSAVSWVMLMFILYISALFFVSFTLFFVLCIEHMQHISSFFSRVVFPMIQLGGTRMPLYVMFQYSFSLGAISLFNPVMFITEGIRQAFFNSSMYLSYLVVFIGLGISLSILMMLCFSFFKKRTDHI